MEHEVYVPFSVGSVRAALAERERVARCVPGLQLDASDDASLDALEGRLRVRIGSSTITYRGSVRLTPGHDGLSVEGGGAEARGSGSVELSLTLAARLSEDGEGTRLVCAGTVKGQGRLAEFEEKTVQSAGARLLDRFGAALGESIGANPPGAAEPGQEAGIGKPDDNERAIPGIPNPEADPEDPDHIGVFEAEIPPSSLDPMMDEGDDAEDAEADRAVTAEAAHARRTMIGRSAEEVDHAPPRGRYAPIPEPEAAATTATLRWAAPAAAAAIAGAIVLTRTLRRRG